MQTINKILNYKKAIFICLISILAFGVLNAVDTCKAKYPYVFGTSIAGSTSTQRFKNYSQAEFSRTTNFGTCNVNGVSIRRFRYDGSTTGYNYSPLCPTGKHLATTETLKLLTVPEFISIASDCGDRWSTSHTGTSVIIAEYGNLVSTPSDGTGTLSVLPPDSTVLGAAYCVDNVRTRDEVMKANLLVDATAGDTICSGIKLSTYTGTYTCPPDTRELKESDLSSISTDDLRIITGNAFDGNCDSFYVATVIAQRSSDSAKRAFWMRNPPYETDTWETGARTGVLLCKKTTKDKQTLMDQYHLKNVRSPVGICGNSFFTTIGSGDNVPRGDCPKGYSLAKASTLEYPSMSWRERFPLQPTTWAHKNENQFCQNFNTTLVNPNAQPLDGRVFYVARGGRYFEAKWLVGTPGGWTGSYSHGPTDDEITGVGYCEKDPIEATKVKAHYEIVPSLSYNKLCGAEGVPVSNTDTDVVCPKGYRTIDALTISSMTTDEYYVLTKDFGGKTAQNCEVFYSYPSRIKLSKGVYATSPTGREIGSTAGSVEYCIPKLNRELTMARWHLKDTNSTALVCNNVYNIERKPTCDNLTVMVEAIDLVGLTHEEALQLTGGSFQSNGACSAITSSADSLFLSVAGGTLEIKSDDSHTFSAYTSPSEVAKGVSYCVLRPVDKTKVMAKYKLSTPLRSAGNCSIGADYAQFSSDVTDSNYPYCPDGTKLMDYELFSKMSEAELTALTDSYQAGSSFGCSKFSNKTSLLLLDNDEYGSYIQGDPQQATKQTISSTLYMGAYCVKAPTQAEIMLKHELIYADTSGWNGTTNCNKIINANTINRLCPDGYEPLNSDHLSKIPKEDVQILTKNPFYDSTCTANDIQNHYIYSPGLPRNDKEGYYDYSYPTFTNTGVTIQTPIGTNQVIAYCKKVKGVYSESRRYGIIKAKTAKKCNRDYMFDSSSDSCPANFKLVSFSSSSDLSNSLPLSITAMFNSISGKTIDSSGNCVNAPAKKVIRLDSSGAFLQYIPSTNTTTFVSDPKLDVSASNVLVPAFCVPDAPGSFDIP